MSEQDGAVMNGASPSLSDMEIDAIGEILNISMGSAATAVSTMLDKQVIITTPKVSVQNFDNIDYTSLEPAMIVKIEYVEGISGSNVMVFRQTDMQIILNLLMGNEDAPSEDFVFDELSMSAACEVMNQMMGASATALSEFLGKTINISTPTAYIMDDEHTFKKAVGVDSDDDIVSIIFNLTIEGVMNSEFISVMTCELAKMIVNQVMGDQSAAAAAAAPPPPAHKAAAPAAQQKPAAPPPPPAQQAPPAAAPQQAPPPAAAAAPPYAPYPPQAAAAPGAMPPAQPPYDPNAAAYYQQQYPYPPMPMYPYGYPPVQGYPPMQGAPGEPPQSGVLHQGQAVNVQNAQFPNFANQPQPVFSAPLTNANMDLVMNVPLSVSVEIGKTKRKIKDIMDFSQGTVIELEKQAGAPVDIVVNGQLIARGDVVVIGDNFGVRVTEIVGTKELIDSIEAN